ncbi:hypothetical protein LCGC14_1711800 [marine sediment metagenome]|uniref:Uncharacterized protein n=1 Tax=marine sediment metagenome TaxID=412755 RepID=A0A0F9HEM4_9ZZZZ
MSLEELISIERVELQATKERLKEVRKDILPLLDIEILLYALKSVPFANEVRGVQILEALNECLDYELYGKTGGWSCKTVANKIGQLKNLVLYDYLIEGSLIVYHSKNLEWDLCYNINFT